MHCPFALPKCALNERTSERHKQQKWRWQPQHATWLLFCSRMLRALQRGQGWTSITAPSISFCTISGSTVGGVRPNERSVARRVCYLILLSDSMSLPLLHHLPLPRQHVFLVKEHTSVFVREGLCVRGRVCMCESNYEQAPYLSAEKWSYCSAVMSIPQR